MHFFKIIKLHLQRMQVLGIPMLADIKQQLNRMENESAMPTQGSEALARMVRDEIERAMMVVVPNGFTIRDTIESHCVRAGDARQRCDARTYRKGWKGGHGLA